MVVRKKLSKKFYPYSCMRLPDRLSKNACSCGSVFASSTRGPPIPVIILIVDISLALAHPQTQTSSPLTTTHHLAGAHEKFQLSCRRPRLSTVVCNIVSIYRLQIFERWSVGLCGLTTTGYDGINNGLFREKKIARRIEAFRSTRIFPVSEIR